MSMFMLTFGRFYLEWTRMEHVRVIFYRAGEYLNQIWADFTAKNITNWNLNNVHAHSEKC